MTKPVWRVAGVSLVYPAPVSGSLCDSAGMAGYGPVSAPLSPHTGQCLCQAPDHSVLNRAPPPGPRPGHSLITTARNIRNTRNQDDFFLFSLNVVLVLYQVCVNRATDLF